MAKIIVMNKQKSCADFLLLFRMFFCHLNLIISDRGEKTEHRVSKVKNNAIIHSYLCLLHDNPGRSFFARFFVVLI